jgi:NTE family protein
MGADIIIGVNVGFPDKTDQNQTESFTEILMAAATISGNISTQTAIKQTDVLISPDLSRYNTASFFESKKIIQLGEEAARKELEKLRNLKDSTRIQTRSPIQICKTPNKVRVAEIQVKGLQNINKQFLLGNLGIEPGDYISPNQMTQALRKAMGTRHFENITYQVKSQSETAVLVLHVEESPRAKAKFSLHYDNEYKAGLITNFTARNVLGKSSRTSFNIDISETPKASLSQINFIGKNKATASRLEVIRENNNFPVYLDNGSKYGTFEHHYTSLRGGIMTTIGTNWQMDAYVRYSLSSLRNESGFSDIFYAGVDHFGNAFFTSSLDFTYNSTDNHYFPHKGTDLQLSCNFNLNATELYSGTREGRSMISDFINIPYKNYFIASGNYNRYIPLNTHLTTGIRLAGQWTNRSIPLMDYTFIGGLPFNNRSKEVHFIGYSFREKIAEDFALGEINFRYKILEQVHINAMGSLLLSRINLPETIEPVGLDKSQRTIGYGLLVAFDSFLGPVQVGVGSNNTDPRARWYFNFGFNF